MLLRASLPGRKRRAHACAKRENQRRSLAMSGRPIFPFPSDKSRREERRTRHARKCAHGRARLRLPRRAQAPISLRQKSKGPADCFLGFGLIKPLDPRSCTTHAERKSESQRPRLKAASTLQLLRDLGTDFTPCLMPNNRILNQCTVYIRLGALPKSSTTIPFVSRHSLRTDQASRQDCTRHRSRKSATLIYSRGRVC